MKQKLKNLESSLAEKLAAAPPASEGRRPRSGGLSRGRLDTVEDVDTQSEVSALHDDVIDAIENPALSDSDADEGRGIHGGQDDENQQDEEAGSEEDEQGLAGAGPAAASLEAAETGRKLELAARAANTLGY